MRPRGSRPARGPACGHSRPSESSARPRGLAAVGALAGRCCRVSTTPRSGRRARLGPRHPGLPAASPHVVVCGLGSGSCPASSVLRDTRARGRGGTRGGAARRARRPRGARTDDPRSTPRRPRTHTCTRHARRARRHVHHAGTRPAHCICPRTPRTRAHTHSKHAQRARTRTRTPSAHTHSKHAHAHRAHARPRGRARRQLSALYRDCLWVMGSDFQFLPRLSHILQIFDNDWL